MKIGSAEETDSSMAKRKILFYGLFCVLLLFVLVLDRCPKYPDKKVPVTEQEREQLFIANIEHHYRELVDCFNKHNSTCVEDKLRLFRLYNMMEYNDISEIDRQFSLEFWEKELRNTPNWQPSKLFEIYTELLKLDPNNAHYQDKLAFYKMKIDEIQARNNKFGAPPSKYNVRQYVRAYLVDRYDMYPHSLTIEDCSDIAYHEEDGYLVQCQFWGKDEFGNYERESLWFVIRHNEVVRVRPSHWYGK